MPPNADNGNFATDEQNATPPTNHTGHVSPFQNPDTSNLSENISDIPGNEVALGIIATAQDESAIEMSARPTLTTASSMAPLYSTFSKNQKHFIIFMASWGGFFSAVSSNIYFPALNTLANDLNVSNGLINLTLTSYMIFQGLAPAFVGDLADAAGRRPAYIFCFVVYISACVGLALQDSYAALFLLRCLQSTGSSATIALSSGVVSDVATAAERGKYIGLVTAGSLLGPAIGPVIGGVLSQFLGWRSLFWFLVILASTWLAIFAIFFPETARTAVGDGSIPPKGLNKSLLNCIVARKYHKDEDRDTSSIPSASNTPKRKLRFPNPLASVPIILDKENAIVLLMNAFLFAAFYDITATIPSLYATIYGFNDLQIGLCYIPFGVGACCAALSNGQLLDRNFLRWARKTGLEVKKGRQQDLGKFPIEKARLQIAFPAFYVSAILILIYGWVIEVNGPLAVVLIILFFSSYSLTVSFNVSSTLLIDFYPHAPATATAANNLFRCLLGAGATGVIEPMLTGMGRGGTFTFLSLFLVASSPLLWVVYFKGMAWRHERRARDDRKAKEKEERRSRDVEKICDRRRIGSTLPVLGVNAKTAATENDLNEVVINSLEEAAVQDEKSEQISFHPVRSRDSGF